MSLIKYINDVNNENKEFININLIKNLDNKDNIYLNNIDINNDFNNSIDANNMILTNEKDIIINKSKFLYSERYYIYSILVKKINENNRIYMSKYIFYYSTINNIRIYLCITFYSILTLIILKKLTCINNYGHEI